MTSKNSKRFDDVRPGEALPELAIPITVLLINSGAIATRDYFPGHHDKDAAQQLSSDDFWAFVERLATGRRLVITSDHGYAATSHGRPPV